MLEMRSPVRAGRSSSHMSLTSIDENLCFIVARLVLSERLAHKTCWLTKCRSELLPLHASKIKAKVESDSQIATTNRDYLSANFFTFELTRRKEKETVAKGNESRKWRMRGWPAGFPFVVSAIPSVSLTLIFILFHRFAIRLILIHII
jgi:hypothetical protein